jgi:hypothetical protein
MSELLDLVAAKIEAERTKLLNSLPSEIEALKRKNSADGLLRSGYTVRGVVDICSASLDSLGRVILDQYQWAVAQSLMTTQVWVEELVLAAPDQLGPLFDRCVEHINREANAAGAPRAVQECVAKLQIRRNEISNDMTLSLRARFAERKRGLVRNIGSAATGWISRLLGGAKL